MRRLVFSVLLCPVTSGVHWFRAPSICRSYLQTCFQKSVLLRIYTVQIDYDARTSNKLRFMDRCTALLARLRVVRSS